MKLTEIQKIIKGNGDAPDLEIEELLIDSRALGHPESTLFFALSTEGNDGHRYIPELIARGVRAFVISEGSELSELSEDSEQPGVTFLRVPSVLDALQACGAAARDKFKGRVVAITGSRGKTTLKEWIFQLCEPIMSVSRSPRSWNSQIGVPLSLWEMNPESQLAIVEAGISKPGEMGTLNAMIRPDTVILTNIGDAHDEGFASKAEKAAEKAKLCCGADTIIYPADDELLAEAIKPYSAGKKIIAWKSDVESPVGNEHERQVAENMGNAKAFMRSMGISDEEIAARFRDLHEVGTRLNVADGVNHCSIVSDSYTSDFSSLRPALNFIRRQAGAGQSLTVILSDLLHERGPLDARRIAEEIRLAGVSRFIGVGEELTANAKEFPDNSLFFKTTDELLATLSPSDFADEIVLIKGAPEYGFPRITEMLEARTHETVLEVNLDAILRNYNYFRSHLPKGTGIVCMVKADAYGAGSFEVARTLQDAGAAYLAVAVLDEGITLRKRGITMPIMVMNPKVVNYRQMFSNRLEPEIYSAEMLADVIREAEKSGIKGYPIHIKLDTGMHRMGFSAEELPALMDMIAAQDAVEISSAFSHLATADCPDMNDYTELQLDRFAEMTDYMLSRSAKPFKRHILNSAGILRYPQYHYDMARLGIGLYGANTLPPDMEEPLAVVSTLRTVIIAIREYPAGETIGYGRRGVLTRPSKIATIPIGYADGMNRHFGRGAINVMVNGHEAPTIGNICMDACMIDVTGIDCHVGDAVEIFGQNMPLQRLADTLDTIPYEVLTAVSPRVKRVYYRE